MPFSAPDLFPSGAFFASATCVGTGRGTCRGCTGCTGGTFAATGGGTFTAAVGGGIFAAAGGAFAAAGGTATTGGGTFAVAGGTLAAAGGGTFATGAGVAAGVGAFASLDLAFGLALACQVPISLKFEVAVVSAMISLVELRVIAVGGCCGVLAIGA